MTLTRWQESTVIVDTTIPILCTLGLWIARYTNRITHSLFLTYFFGALIGALWEIPFGIAGDEFLISKFDNPLGSGVHILHCFWDSIIFLIGMYFIHFRNDNRYCGLKQLGLLTVWGVLQEFIVELMYNDKYWYYKTDNKYNPVVFTIKGVSYTCVPYLVWIICPILYLSGVFSIIEVYGPLRKDGRRNITDDRSVNLLMESDTDNSSLSSSSPTGQINQTDYVTTL
jgi:hypothetical protein